MNRAYRDSGKAYRDSAREAYGDSSLDDLNLSDFKEGILTEFKDVDALHNALLKDESKVDHFFNSTLQVPRYLKSKLKRTLLTTKELPLAPL